MTLYQIGRGGVQEATVATGASFVPVFDTGTAGLSVPGSSFEPDLPDKVWQMQFACDMDEGPSGHIKFEIEADGSPLVIHDEPRPVGSGPHDWWDGAPHQGPAYFHLAGTPTIQGRVTNNTPNNGLTTFDVLRPQAFLGMLRQDITPSTDLVGAPNCNVNAFYSDGDILALRYDSTTGNIFVDQFRNDGTFIRQVLVANVGSAPDFRDISIGPNGDVIVLYDDKIVSVNRDDRFDVNTVFDVAGAGYGATAMCTDGAFVYLLIPQPITFSETPPGTVDIPTIMRVNMAGTIVQIAGSDTWYITNAMTKVPSSGKQMFQLVGGVFVFNTELLYQPYETIMGFTLTPTIESHLSEVIGVTDAFTEVGFTVNKLVALSATESIAAGTDGTTNAVGKHTDGTLYEAGTAPNEGLDVRLDPDGLHVWISSAQGLYKFDIAAGTLIGTIGDCFPGAYDPGCHGTLANDLFFGEYNMNHETSVAASGGEEILVWDTQTQFWHVGVPAATMPTTALVIPCSIGIRWEQLSCFLTFRDPGGPPTTGSFAVEIHGPNGIEASVTKTATEWGGTGTGIDVMLAPAGVYHAGDSFFVKVVNNTDVELIVRQFNDQFSATAYAGLVAMPGERDFCWDKFVVVNCEEQATAYSDMIGRGGFSATVDAHQVFPGLARVPKVGTTQNLFTRTTPP